MPVKRKTVSKLAATTPKISKLEAEEQASEEEDEAEAQIVAVPEEKELTEKELVAQRTKELQSTKMDDLKELLTSAGLETGKKDAMIKAILKHEAKARATAREQKSKIRAVVIKKKQELESSSLPALGKACEALGLKGLKSKEERVQRLLIHWQENDGVDRALEEIASDERMQQLNAMDTTNLQKLCNKMGVDPFVKEIMVDRLSKRELEMGSYSRPVVPQEESQAAAPQGGDMVEALLAQEANRKKERELKSQQEDQAAQKRKEFKALSIEDLKKRLSKKGLEATGKKDDMVEALFIAAMQEEAAGARQSALKAKSLPELKELLSRYGLEQGSKEQMVKTMLAYEAKCRENTKAFEAKVAEAADQKKEELDRKNNAALKDLCVAKGLAVGGGKEERIARIVEETVKAGELDAVVSMNLRNKRKEELMSMDKPSVLKICEKTSVDPFVKNIMVERIMSAESEGGAAIAMSNSEAPAAKKPRTSKK